MGKKRGLFSANIRLIAVDRPLSYDLYINSSGHDSRNNFVKIAVIGETLTDERLKEIQARFYQIYILEQQRGAYLNSLIASGAFSIEEKGAVVKGFAIEHLDKMFKEKATLDQEGLSQLIQDCMDTIESMIELTKNQNVSKIHGMIEKLMFHDFYTYDHSVNVSFYNIALLRHINPSASHKELKSIGLGGLLHDLGKIEIPTTIINKAEKLTEEEFQTIQEHPDKGKCMIVDQVDAPDVDFNVVRRIVHEHHENYNGSGYPQGLEGEQIHSFARIAAITDFFDAITTKRSYQKVHPIGEALHIMSHARGRKLDPALFDLFRESLSNKAFGGRKNLKLRDDFDPCQPQEEFPLEETTPQVQTKNIDLDIE